MNLRYTVPLCLLLAGGAMAQWANPRQAKKVLPSFAEQHTVVADIPHDEDHSDRGNRDIVFTEDFANGLGGNSGFGPWSLSGPNGNIWKHTTTAPNGAYTDANEIIASPTVGNGYMLFASDSANSDWSGSEPVMVAAPVNFEGSLVSPTLDLSASPYVEVVFEQRLRYCCGDAPHYLEVSTDNGNSWPYSYPTSTGVAVNAASGTETRKVNITQGISANPSNVTIRFRHNGEAGTSHYHWQLDDINIVELEEYDLRVTGTANTDFDINTAATYDSLNYSIYPFSQLRPIGLNMTVLNNGSMAQDAVANFTVINAGNTVLDQDQAVPNLVQGESRKIFVDPGFTPPPVPGTYNVTHSITSSNPDNVPEDNTAASSFKVDASIYARDGGASWVWEEGDNSFMIVANAFYIDQPVFLTSISVIIGTGSEVGAFIVGDLRADDLETILAESNEVVLASNMFNGVNGQNYTQLNFDPPVELVPGTDYMACVQAYGDIRIGTNGNSPPQSSFIFYNGASGEDWYYTTTTPAVRMNLTTNVGVEEIMGAGVVMSQAIPNPSNGATRLVYTIEEAAPVSIELLDVSGKLVRSFEQGTRAAGQHQLQFDVADLQDGVYMYVVKAGTQNATGRLVVVK